MNSTVNSTPNPSAPNTASLNSASLNSASPNAASPSAASPSTPVAVITGASRGLGLELARALARDGWQLVITARDPGALAAAEAELSPYTKIAALPGSVVDDDHRAELADAAAQLGGATLLVNNASTLAGYDLAGGPMPSLAEFPLPGLLETFEVNVLAPIALTQLVLPQLRARGGAVINLSSDAAVEPYAGWGGYGAAKAALDHASAILAREEPELRVWAVDPGDMRTRMHQEAFPGEDISDRPLPVTVVPAFRVLLRDRPASGRYAAAELTADQGV
ncbi:SDR family oxidoreductase [Kitasatospora azatica]|uniref:SDR family oxidoreductase n=1 Tax=Kitasatospora azatica TaxID=58347 RepID=UPI000A06F4E0|nr:SDR family oxidoreductase [Kitasatospora azatica]